MIDQNSRMRILPILLVALTCLLAGCAPAPVGAPRAWIDVPLSGLTFAEGQVVTVEGHAAAADGIQQVEIWANGVVIQTITASAVNETLSRFEWAYLPPGPGEYTLQAIAFTADGVASAPDTALIRVGALAAEVEITPSLVEAEDGATPTPTPTVTPTKTPTPVPPVIVTTVSPVPLVQFWAVPDVIDAGACTTINWHVENVASVFYAGSEQAFDGSYQDCFCEEQWLPMTIGYLDGSSEQFTLHIAVNGTCATAVPVPPAAPVLAKPVNGITLGCVGSTTIMWNAVSHPSGISEYQVQVERHSGDNNWATVSGSPFTGIGGTNTSVPVECGWYYRWRVRALDGTGTAGAWSGWWTFTVTLT